MFNRRYIYKSHILYLQLLAHINGLYIFIKKTVYTGTHTSYHSTHITVIKKSDKHAFAYTNIKKKNIHAHEYHTFFYIHDNRVHPSLFAKT